MEMIKPEDQYVESQQVELLTDRFIPFEIKPGESYTFSPVKENERAYHPINQDRFDINEIVAFIKVGEKWFCIANTGAEVNAENGNFISNTAKYEISHEGGLWFRGIVSEQPTPVYGDPDNEDSHRFYIAKNSENDICVSGVYPNTIFVMLDPSAQSIKEISKPHKPAATTPL